MNVPARRAGRGRPLLLAVAVAVGVGARLWLILGSVGTDDVGNWALWAEAGRRFGLVRAWQGAPQFMHPWLALAQAVLLRRLADGSGVPFGDLLRLVQLAADLLAFGCLLALGRRTGVGEWVAPFYLLAPPAVLISGFHGNVDPTMVALVLAAAAWLACRPAAAGAVLAAATGLKVVPLLLAPLFFAAARTRRWRFTAGWAVTMALLFGLPTLLGGVSLLRHILSYRGVGNWWGPVSMLVAGGRGRPWLAPALAWVTTIDPLFIVAAVLGIAAWLWRRLEVDADPSHDLALLLAACGMVLTALIVAGTGFGVQYLLWPVPFLPFFTRAVVRVLVVAATSVFLVVVYTHWAGGFPWWLALSTRPGATTDAMVYGGWGVWATLAAALALAPSSLPWRLAPERDGKTS